MTDTGEVIEFCDPRIQTIKKQSKKYLILKYQSPLYFMELRKPKSETDI
jgi:hypothetical protein